MTVPPQAGPAPARIGLGRSYAVVTIAVLAFLLVFVVAGVWGGIGATDTSSRFLSLGIAALFAVPLLMLFRAMPKMFAPRFVIVDGAGLAIAHGKETILVPWQEIRAYGIGYALAEPEKITMPRSMDGVKDRMAEHLSKAAAEALHVSDKRQLALEIFPAVPEAFSRYPRLKPFWKQLPPPLAGLPATRWQFPLPPVVPIAQQVAEALAGWSPQRWTGWFPVSWRGNR